MLYDAHCHLDFPVFDADRDQVLQRAKLAGVTSIILAATTAATWPRLLNLVESSSLPTLLPSPQLYACLGLHPLFIAEHKLADLIQLKNLLLKTPQIIALGEVSSCSLS